MYTVMSMLYYFKAHISYGPKYLFWRCLALYSPERNCLNFFFYKIYTLYLIQFAKILLIQNIIIIICVP